MTKHSIPANSKIHSTNTFLLLVNAPKSFHYFPSTTLLSALLHFLTSKSQPFRQHSTETHFGKSSVILSRHSHTYLIFQHSLWQPKCTQRGNSETRIFKRELKVSSFTFTSKDLIWWFSELVELVACCLYYA